MTPYFDKLLLLKHRFAALGNAIVYETLYTLSLRLSADIWAFSWESALCSVHPRRG